VTREGPSPGLRWGFTMDNDSGTTSPGMPATSLPGQARRGSWDEGMGDQHGVGVQEEELVSSEESRAAATPARDSRAVSVPRGPGRSSSMRSMHRTDKSSHTRQGDLPRGQQLPEEITADPVKAIDEKRTPAWEAADPVHSAARNVERQVPAGVCNIAAALSACA
jgi:hypothetical protein